VTRSFQIAAAVLAVLCAGGSAVAQEIDGAWLLQKIDGHQLMASGPAFTIRDGAIEGVTGCAAFGGSAVVHEGRLLLGEEARPFLPADKQSRAVPLGMSQPRCGQQVRRRVQAAFMGVLMTRPKVSLAGAIFVSAPARATFAP
jgi:hypothetical protein